MCLFVCAPLYLAGWSVRTNTLEVLESNSNHISFYCSRSCRSWMCREGKIAHNQKITKGNKISNVFRLVVIVINFWFGWANESDRQIDRQRENKKVRRLLLYYTYLFLIVAESKKKTMGSRLHVWYAYAKVNRLRQNLNILVIILTQWPHFQEWYQVVKANQSRCVCACTVEIERESERDNLHIYCVHFSNVPRSIAVCNAFFFPSPSKLIWMPNHIQSLITIIRYVSEKYSTLLYIDIHKYQLHLLSAFSTIGVRPPSPHIIQQNRKEEEKHRKEMIWMEVKEIIFAIDFLYLFRLGVFIMLYAGGQKRTSTEILSAQGQSEREREKDRERKWMM